MVECLRPGKMERMHVTHFCSLSLTKTWCSYYIWADGYTYEDDPKKELGPQCLLAWTTHSVSTKNGILPQLKGCLLRYFLSKRGIRFRRNQIISNFRSTINCCYFRIPVWWFEKESRDIQKESYVISSIEDPYSYWIVQITSWTYLFISRIAE